MPNNWVSFVKDYASKNNLSYGCAMTKPECKSQYKEKYGNRKKLSTKKEKELMSAEDVNVAVKKRKPPSEAKERFKMATEDVLSKKMNDEAKKEAKENITMNIEDVNRQISPIKIPRPPKRHQRKKLVIVEPEPVPVVAEPKKKGRKPKYATEEERKKAKRQQTLASNKKRYGEKKMMGKGNSSSQRYTSLSNVADDENLPEFTPLAQIRTPIFTTSPSETNVLNENVVVPNENDIVANETTIPQEVEVYPLLQEVLERDEILDQIRRYIVKLFLDDLIGWNTLQELLNYYNNEVINRVRDNDFILLVSSKDFDDLLKKVLLKPPYKNFKAKIDVIVDWIIDHTSYAPIHQAEEAEAVIEGSGKKKKLQIHSIRTSLPIKDYKPLTTLTPDQVLEKALETMPARANPKPKEVQKGKGICGGSGRRRARSGQQTPEQKSIIDDIQKRLAEEAKAEEENKPFSTKVSMKPMNPKLKAKKISKKRIMPTIPEGDETNGDGLKTKRPKLVKGSQEAKDFMKMLRDKRKK